MDNAIRITLMIANSIVILLLANSYVNTNFEFAGTICFIGICIHVIIGWPYVNRVLDKCLKGNF